jgi:heme oxygenase
MTTATEAPSIMLQLKESTQIQHDTTENGDFNKELVQGRLSKDQYVESLGQLFLIHARLESQLRSLKSNVPAISRVVHDYQFQEPYLRNDLAYFGRPAEEIRPLPATKRFLEQIDHIAAECPAALLGMHYVFEGSNNGSKFISRAVRKAYNLTDLHGTHYLDPYGDHQKDYWQAFKNDMNSQQFTEAESSAMVAAAGATFQAIGELHRELYAPSDVKQPANEASVSKCPFHHG